MVRSEKYVKYYACFCLRKLYVICVVLIIMSAKCILWQLYNGVASLIGDRDIDQRTAGTNADWVDSPASIILGTLTATICVCVALGSPLAPECYFSAAETVWCLSKIVMCEAVCSSWFAVIGYSIMLVTEVYQDYASGRSWVETLFAWNVP